jgi:hypothetical protein
MKAWHFALSDGCLGFGDGRKIVVGETLRVDGQLRLCKRGLHASRLVYDALGYAGNNSTLICRVSLGGQIVTGEDKICASERTVLWAIDGRSLLRHYARLCALDVIAMWDAPEVVVRYLRTGDESLRLQALAATESPAWAAVGAEVGEGEAVETSWAAAEASWAASWAAAWAARVAARAARTAVGARAATLASVRAKQNHRLERMIHRARKH